MKSLFEPFGRTSNKAYVIMVVVQIILLFVLLLLFQSPIIPSPISIGKSLLEITTSSEFYSDLFKSVLFTTKGMGIAVLISMLIAYISTIRFFFPLGKLISLFRYLTITGLTYVFTVLSQNGTSLKMNILLFGIVPFFVTSLLSIINSIPQEEYRLCSTLKMNSWRTLWEVVIVGRFDYLFEVIRQNFAICWMMITTVEGLCMSEGGIGTIIIKSAKYLDMSKVLASLLIIFLIGVLFDFTMRKLSKSLFPYAV